MSLHQPVSLFTPETFGFVTMMTLTMSVMVKMTAMLLLLQLMMMRMMMGVPLREHNRENAPSRSRFVLSIYFFSKIGAEAIYKLAEARVKLGKSRQTIPINHLTLSILKDAQGKMNAF